MLTGLQELELSGLKLMEANADYSGTQTIFIDFDGAEGVSYDNEALNIHIGGLSIADSGLSQSEQTQILSDLNNTFAGTGVTFTATAPVNEEYSTIYVGGDDAAFSGYGSFNGLAETLDAGNQIKNDEAFVFSDKINSTAAITETIAHEAGHLLGFEHESAISHVQTISSYALESSEQVTLKIVNNFLNDTEYFSENYADSTVWLYFLNTGSSVTYTNILEQEILVADGSAFQLLEVKDGTFTITDGPGSTKVYAALGVTNPFSGLNGPGVFDKDIPYSVVEWTFKEGANDNVDVSYEDTYSFPTTLRVMDSSGTQVDRATFKNNTTAESLIDALKAVMPSVPTGPTPEYHPPQSGDPAGWGPLVPTVHSDPDAQRWIGSSKYWPSGQEEGSQQSMYQYAPSFNDYLKYLQDNETILFPSDNSISGWYVDYSGNLGYSFYVSVTGTEGNYGLSIHDIRANAGGVAPDWTADPTAGTALTGDITIAANGAMVSYPSTGGGTYEINGNWTDVTLYSGASLLNGDFASGPIITGTGDFAYDGAYNDLNSAIIASLSASVATGLLGNSFYMDKIGSATDPGATMYWFNTLLRDEFDTVLFDAGWSAEQEFYDPYWETMADYTNMQGYLSPFNDRWQNFSPDFKLLDGYSMEWELGVLPLTKMAATDFVGNGQSDVLSYSSDTGYVTLYLNETSTVVQTIAGGVDPASWDYSGTGDYNADGFFDILWRNKTTGDVGAWLMDNGEYSTWTNIAGAATGEWEISGSGDFNGDGTADVLWYNTQSGLMGAWMVDNGVYSSWSSIGGVDAESWEFSGIGDFNDDNVDDILWVNKDSGLTGAWLIENGTYSSWSGMAGADLNSWELSGVGDFNDDGTDDVLWINKDTGLTGAWLIENGTYSSWTSMAGADLNSWSLEGTGDYNGDGTDDVLWCNNDSGLLGYWQIENGQYTNWVTIALT
jgi:hypothetical protein